MRDALRPTIAIAALVVTFSANSAEACFWPFCGSGYGVGYRPAFTSYYGSYYGPTFAARPVFAQSYFAPGPSCCEPACAPCSPCQSCVSSCNSCGCSPCACSPCSSCCGDGGCPGGICSSGNCASGNCPGGNCDTGLSSGPGFTPTDNLSPSPDNNLRERSDGPNRTFIEQPDETPDTRFDRDRSFDRDRGLNNNPDNYDAVPGRNDRTNPDQPDGFSPRGGTFGPTSDERRTEPEAPPGFSPSSPAPMSETPPAGPMGDVSPMTPKDMTDPLDQQFNRAFRIPNSIMNRRSPAPTGPPTPPNEDQGWQKSRKAKQPHRLLAPSFNLDEKIARRTISHRTRLLKQTRFDRAEVVVSHRNVELDTKANAGWVPVPLPTRLVSK